MLPWYIGFLIFMLYPIVYSLYLSMNHVLITPMGIETKWRGIENFRNVLLADARFMTELLVFVEVLVFSVPLVVIFSLFIAILINYPIKARGFFRAVFFLPVVITSGEVVNELFSQGAGTVPIVEQYGIIDIVATNLPPYLVTPVLSIVSRLIMILWYSGVQVLIFLSGLQKINRSVYEAASVDGASPWEFFWKITLPFLKPFILINMIYTIVNLCTSPINAIIDLIRDTMYSVSTGYGYASAMAWIYLLTVFIIVGVVMLLFGRSDEDRKTGKKRRAGR
jgi:ABC-type sugar transport system permease subunit